MTAVSDPPAIQAHLPRDPIARLTALFDPDTMSVLTTVPYEGSGAVAAAGLIDGSGAVAFASDPRVQGGAMGTEGCAVLVAAYDEAIARGVPIIGLWHSGGARLAEGVASLDGVGAVFAAMTAASGVVPQISVVLGPAAGGAAYGPALTDIVILSSAGRIFVTGPDVVRSVTGEDVDMIRLGGPEVHSRRSGVVHLVAADDVARTAELIAAEWVNEFNRGGLSTVSGWLDLLPGGTVLQDPRLSVARSWIALNEGRLDDAAFWVDAVEARAAAAAGGATIGAQAVVLRAILSFKVGDVAAALETAGRATTLDLGEAPLARSGLYCIYGNALYFSGRIDEAQASYRRAAQRAERIGDRRYRIYALGYLALIAAERGQLTDAERQIRRANGGGTDLAAEEFFVGVMVSLGAATVLNKRGDLAAAGDAVDMAVASARQGGALPEVAKALFVRAEIFERLGDQETAEASRTEAAILAQDCGAAGAGLGVPAREGRRASVTQAALSTESETTEPLTQKELEVLRLLATRLSRREIGERMYVSLNTVKTHQRAVYRKLGVEDRSAAITRARELGLV